MHCFHAAPFEQECAGPLLAKSMLKMGAGVLSASHFHAGGDDDETQRLSL